WRAGRHGGFRVHSLDGAIWGQALSCRWLAMAKTACSRSGLRHHGLFALSFFSRCPRERSSANESRPIRARRANFAWHSHWKILLYFHHSRQRDSARPRGPGSEVGAGIASVLGRKLGLRPEKVKALVPVGAAAAIAAAFNTPLAAVLFALEE